MGSRLPVWHITAGTRTSPLSPAPRPPRSPEKVAREPRSSPLRQGQCRPCLGGPVWAPPAREGAKPERLRDGRDTPRRKHQEARKAQPWALGSRRPSPHPSRCPRSSPVPADSHLVKQLQHDGQHIWMGFVHLIEEHHGVGALLQLLGQLATLLVANVAWWGPYKLGHLGRERRC